MKTYCLLLTFFFINFCYGQNDKAKKIAEQPRYTPTWLNPNVFQPAQISQYIRRMLQDKAGNIWFGTNGDGVCRYDGKSFVYFTTKEGLAGDAVRAMLQDEKGIIWFATSGGISKYDPSGTDRKSVV